MIVNTHTRGNVNQHLAYMPFGEDFINERSDRDIRFKFTGKERDAETGFDFFGARYYESDLSVWLSVDPLAAKYPTMSPYMYCAGNPVMFIDPDGMRLKPTNKEAEEILTNLLAYYGRGLFQIVEAPLGQKMYQVNSKLSLRKFRKQLIVNGYKKGTDRYKGAISLFKLLKSKKLYELTAVSTKSTTKSSEDYNSRVKNDDVDNFKKNYRIGENGEVLRTPTQNEINNFLEKGKSNGKGWGLFDDRRNEKGSIERGRIIIDISPSSHTYDYDSQTTKQKNINLLKTATNGVSKEIKDVK